MSEKQYKTTEAQRRAVAKYEAKHPELYRKLKANWQRNHPDLNKACVAKFRARQKLIKEQFLEFAAIDISCV